MDIIKRLENWYFSHCDNDWEHSYGVKIGTLDNPGWFVEINLTDTLLEDIPFEAVEFGDSEDRSATWLHCHYKDAVFFGYGSYQMLSTILQKFLDWADANTDTTPWDDTVSRLHAEILQMTEHGTLDTIERLREIYKETYDIPTEHPQKRALLQAFEEVWDKQWAKT